MFQWNFMWGRDTDLWGLSISAVIDCLGNQRPPSFLWLYKLPRTLGWGSDLIWVGRENGFALLNRIIAFSKTERQKPEAELWGNKLKMKPLLNFPVSFPSLSPLQRAATPAFEPDPQCELWNCFSLAFPAKKCTLESSQGLRKTQGKSVTRYCQAT